MKISYFINEQVIREIKRLEATAEAGGDIKKSMLTKFIIDGGAEDLNFWTPVAIWEIKKDEYTEYIAGFVSDVLNGLTYFKDVDTWALRNGMNAVGSYFAIKELKEEDEKYLFGQPVYYCEFSGEIYTVN